VGPAFAVLKGQATLPGVIPEGTLAANRGIAAGGMVAPTGAQVKQPGSRRHCRPQGVNGGSGTCDADLCSAASKGGQHGFTLGLQVFGGHRLTFMHEGRSLQKS
jgi:hypothetical protein